MAHEIIGNLKTLYQSSAGRKANSTIFFGQLFGLPEMSEEDTAAYKKLIVRHFPSGTHIAWWPREKPSAIQAFLRDWCRDQALELLAVVEYERPGDGYFEWRLDYLKPHGRWE